MMQRLDKILANMGYGSRKEIKSMIKDGVVTVNGQVLRDSSIHVDPEISEIVIKGEIVQYREFVYVMMNKPQGVISATEDRVEKTVVDLLSEEYAPFSIYPVGRLDKDTEGLLLLTNDGPLTHRLLSPRSHVPKTYFARVAGNVNDDDADIFRKGVALDDGYVTLPAELVVLQSADGISEVELTIYEGKFHQVKRMFKAVNKEVIFLKRLSMGPLLLDPSLKPGEYRELTAEELDSLLQHA